MPMPDPRALRDADEAISFLLKEIKARTSNQNQMKVRLSDEAIESLKDAPINGRRAFEKPLRFLASDPKHPSVHAKYTMKDD